MHKYLLFSILCIVSLNACHKEGDIISELEIIVSSDMVTGIDPVGGGEVHYIQIKEMGDKSGNWKTIRPLAINGFDYEAGYEYLLKVKKIRTKNPLQDQATIKYELIKIISQISKHEK
ncbi:MAG: DUF4377 domain-containing protein [Proteiniphilum sp.]